jgi:hypothetical protein
MSRALFTQADVTRALKGAKKAGFAVDRAVINRTGDIVLEFQTAEAKPRETERNPWDEVLIDAADKERSA